MAEAADESDEQDCGNFDTQCLKVDFHSTVTKICQETEKKFGLHFSFQVIVTITEALWKHTKTYAFSLREYARLMQRTELVAEDVIHFTRHNQFLYEHLYKMYQDRLHDRYHPRTKGQKRKSPPMGAMTKKLSEAWLQEAAVNNMDVDEENDKWYE